ncbi:aromatic amino acid lyase [Coprothermobacteraceae bacterium]|nr:aromatic amino acid lyase [Coprothermobacteraceae bacterium]
MEISEQLDLGRFWSVVSGKEKVEVSSETRERLSASRSKLMAAAAQGKTIYGLNTGVGVLKDVILNGEDLRQFQVNLIKSHAQSTGPCVGRSVVRGAMLLLAHSLAQGYSGVRPEVVERLVWCLNEDLIPKVGSFGSVGASGDLAPLSVIASSLAGLSPVEDGQGRSITLDYFGLEEKEGLALINGTHFSLSHFLHKFELFKKLDEFTRWVFCLYLEARSGIVSFLNPLVSRVKPDPYMGELIVWLRKALEGSPNVRESGPEVQEPYVVRCFPQIYASVLRTVDSVSSWLQGEMNSVSDNPLFDGDVPIFQGNFHAENIAIMSSQLRSLVPLMANILYQLQEKLLNPAFNRGLPAFLAEKPGFHSGAMIVQYLGADLLSEISLLASPITVVNQTMSAGQEDFVSFAPASNRLLERQLDLYSYLLASTLVIGMRAVRMGKRTLAPGVERALSPFKDYEYEGERSFSEVIEQVAKYLSAER